MFGSKYYMTPEQLNELLNPLGERIAQLEEQVREMREEIASLRRNDDHTAVADQPSDAAVADVPPVIGINMEQAEAFAPQGGSARTGQDADTILYLQAPTADGVFTHSSEREQIGKSIYQLNTKDGVNGSFILIDSPDAIATATISVSQFVKPVCKVNGVVRSMPRHIVTEEEGMVQKDAEGWRVTRKAVVRFE